MNKLKLWFVNLSRVGKVSVLASLVLGGGFLASAAALPTPAETQQDTVQQAVVKPVETTKTETELVAIPFGKSTKEDGTAAKGQTRIGTNGVDGVKTVTHTITYTDGVETNRISSEVITTQPIEEVTLLGTYVAPAPAPAPRSQAASCDPNYSGGCVPVVSYDLDCGNIGFAVTVVGNDRHRFDGDRDGMGCESYR